MNNTHAIFVALIAIGFVVHSANADTTIPSWIKSDAKYWKEGQIGDDEYVKGVQYLLQNDVIQIPSSDMSLEKSTTIPSWVKNNAGYWADGSLTDAEYVMAIQYLIGIGVIDVGASTVSSTNPVPESNVPGTSKCDAMITDADKQTCIEAINAEENIKASIAKATPLVVGPVTYYIVSTDLIDTGDGGSFITVHTVLENTGSMLSNPDLFCTGPFACNYHLTDGQKDYPPSIYSLTSGHLQLVYQKPVAIDWNFYSKQNVGGYKYDPSKTYSFKVSEPFGSGMSPLKLVLQ